MLYGLFKEFLRFFMLLLILLQKNGQNAKEMFTNSFYLYRYNFLSVGYYNIRWGAMLWYP